MELLSNLKYMHMRIYCIVLDLHRHLLLTLVLIYILLFIACNAPSTNLKTSNLWKNIAADKSNVLNANNSPMYSSPIDCQHMMYYDRWKHERQLYYLHYTGKKNWFFSNSLFHIWVAPSLFRSSVDVCKEPSFFLVDWNNSDLLCVAPKQNTFLWVKSK